jgi:predicted RNA binding protein YcfA (HicA-like mRNA interferase family)
MKSADLLRRLGRLATRRCWTFEIKEGGAHTKVRLNGRTSMLPRHAADLPTGTYRGILKQLGISTSDLED